MCTWQHDYPSDFSSLRKDELRDTTTPTFISATATSISQPEYQGNQRHLNPGGDTTSIWMDLCKCVCELSHIHGLI